MNFIHARDFLHQGDRVIVECSHPCNIRLMDDSNFGNYRTSGRHTYYGGFYKMLPAQIAVPHDGYWNVTIDLGGAHATIQYRIRYLKRNAA